MTLISIMISLLGLLIGFIQTINMKRLKDAQKINVWTSISKNKALMRNLERCYFQMAHQNALDLFRSLLNDAVILEIYY